ncbi:MoaA/NifB/PqqE/SkfB family radical SAM enzyme [Saonia flava]|uniref:MoaA/NifB/PqqE/SkfB family radical SAM enzyme n=1 Tax=Saonia flava TaxID=523696 RepID=A0A846QSE8_9FLAO|nr:radical SAM protein [Saonia flava]NJB69890.1 MoaA/NifB/PqqE/SkfB family radical SAM enzyme [Saonia flava]
MNHIHTLVTATQKENTSISHGENIQTNQPKVLVGRKKIWVHLRLKYTLLGIAIKSYSNPFDWIGALRYLVKLRKRFLGNHRLQKIALVDDRYYMGLYTPGWNSPVYKTFIASQLNDYKPINGTLNRFNNAFVAITKKCALQCEHCFEWDTLNKKDVLSAEKLTQIVRKLQEQGVSQIQFSGGEPLLKIDMLLEVLEKVEKKTDFWILTSGFKLTHKNAKKLKKAGVTGFHISLDHFVPEKHNEFRGFKEAYYWVEEAVKNAHEHGLATALSLCATRDFISRENLLSYMELAKRLNVSFVQLLEPKAVGHYAAKDVLLQPHEISLLEEFYLTMNFDPACKTYPIVTYHGYYQRRQGCYSAGVKGLYVDTDGDINACPFCQKKTGNVLDGHFDQNLKKLQEEGCPTYTTKRKEPCL